MSEAVDYNPEDVREVTVHYVSEIGPGWETFRYIGDRVLGSHGQFKLDTAKTDAILEAEVERIKAEGRGLSEGQLKTLRRITR